MSISHKPVALTCVLLLLTVCACSYQTLIPCAPAIEAYIDWVPLSEEEKVSLRARWSKVKVQEVMAALKAKRSLPVEEIPFDVMFEDYDTSALRKIVGDRNFFRLKFRDLRCIPFTNCDLGGVDLSFTYLEGAELQSCNLMHVNLAAANLTDANLQGARLHHANLENALLRGANLSEANLADASLVNAALYSCNLENTFLYNADLERARLADIRSGILSVLVGQGAFRQSRLNANLKQANLYHTNLKGAVLAGANLEDANLFGAVFGDTPVDASQLEKAQNYRYIRPGKGPPTVNLSSMVADLVEDYHREAKSFFIRNQMGEMAAEYHFWENEAKTRRSPWYIRIPRLVFLKWPYGYGSRPIWLLGYSLLFVSMFGVFFTLVTLNRKTKSGIYSVIPGDEEGEPVPLSWRKGLLVADCMYFSLLSFATFGYGAFRPRQWIEFFRLEQVEYIPVRWARILVGAEATMGIYLFALLTTVLFGKW